MLNADVVLAAARSRWRCAGSLLFLDGACLDESTSVHVSYLRVPLAVGRATEHEQPRKSDAWPDSTSHEADIVFSFHSKMFSPILLV
jgi:hypothetical protein